MVIGCLTAIRSSFLDGAMKVVRGRRGRLLNMSLECTGPITSAVGIMNPYRMYLISNHECMTCDFFLGQGVDVGRMKFIVIFFYRRGLAVTTCLRSL